LDHGVESSHSIIYARCKMFEKIAEPAVALEPNCISDDVFNDEHLVFDNKFQSFFQKLNVRFGSMQKNIKRLRRERLSHAHNGNLPQFLRTEIRTAIWSVSLPDWAKDQRNQMTGPADNPELIVKLLNSNAPGVMLDLEDSMANNPAALLFAHDLIKSALYGTLTYQDRNNKTVKINRPGPVVWLRPRGLHMEQILPTKSKKIYRASATVYDLAYHFYDLNLNRLAHPPCIYIPKSEGAQEAHWWREMFTMIEKLRKWPHGTIKCMALVESHPMAFEMDEFLYFLRPYIIGLNLGRWDYMASTIHYLFHDKKWILPDRDKIPHDSVFFQQLRRLMVNTCHKRGALAIGGMTALFPSRTDVELNNMALDILAKDKRNESWMGMDGAWTGHPDQNVVAIRPFPEPNQIGFLHENLSVTPEELRTPPSAPITEEGSRAAIRTALRYRIGVAQGKGAVLINGYMEDLATDRICRLMIAQRLRHGIILIERFEQIFDEEEKLVGEVPNINVGEIAKITKNLIYDGKFDPE
jgi:malate synthase